MYKSITSQIIPELTVALTCHCYQGTKELDQGQYEGDAKITRKREEECITVCLHGMLGGRKAETLSKTDAAITSGLRVTR